MGAIFAVLALAGGAYYLSRWRRASGRAISPNLIPRLRNWRLDKASASRIPDFVSVTSLDVEHGRGSWYRRTMSQTTDSLPRNPTRPRVVVQPSPLSQVLGGYYHEKSSDAQPRPRQGSGDLGNNMLPGGVVPPPAAASGTASVEDRGSVPRGSTSGSSGSSGSVVSESAIITQLMDDIAKFQGRLEAGGEEAAQ